MAQPEDSDELDATASLVPSDRPRARTTRREIDEPLLVSRRFDVHRRLGAGGMGVVYEATDRETGSRLAVKTLRGLTGNALLRFKNELRSAREIRHPNVIELGELLEEDGRWLFTMELVDGEAFVEHVRPGGVLDEARLRSALAQLVSGLGALHAAGMIHRDVKSSNVLVTREGRVVVLDFGLITERGVGELPGLAVGTPATMAPEQATGESVGPEADWYGVGVMLYAALVGRYPFRGSGEQMVAQKLAREPDAVRAIEPSAPLDLAELTDALLRIAPSLRPSGTEIAARVGASMSRATGGRLVGRRAELAQIEAALVDATRGAHAVSLLLDGESGVGKSRIAAAFVDAHPEALFLRARCHERESVPFKAVDGLVDALCRRIRTWADVDRAALLPPHADALAYVFPVLRELPELASVDLARTGAVDPHALRARLFAAARELFARLGASHRLALVIDDLQWADADSLALLAEILRPPESPRLLFLATLRDARVAVRSLDQIAAALPGDVRRAHVEGLSRQDAELLARSLLREAGIEADVAARIASEAGGHPLFIDELVRRGTPGEGVRLDDALGARIEALAPEARRVLDLLALSGTPIALDVTARAAGASVASLVACVASLRGQKLLGEGGARPGDLLETYHDRIRDAALSRIAAVARAQLHGSLATALEGEARIDAEALSVHWEGAGQQAVAATWAARAAAEAGRVLAFDRAARLYARAHALDPTLVVEDDPVIAKLADALAAAGRGREAGDAFVEAIAVCSAERRIELERRAAEQYLRSGHVDEGTRVLDRVLPEIGMARPRTPGGALASLLFRRGLLAVRGLEFVPRKDALPPKERERIDVCWSIATVLGNVDTVRGADFQARHLLLALGSGDRYRIARALAIEAAYSALDGEPARARTASILGRARGIASELGDAHATGLVIGCDGLSAFLEGRYADGRRLCAEAERIFVERCAGVVGELAHAQLYSLLSLAFLGDIGMLRRLGPDLARKAAERGDLYSATNIRTRILHLVHLADHRPDAARSETDEAMAAWTRTGIHLQHVFELIARTQIDLYDGRLEEAHARATETAPRLHAAFLTRISSARSEIQHAVARATLALATQKTGREQAKLLSVAETEARRLVRDRAIRAAEPFGLAVLAAVAERRGRRDEALAAMERAETLAEAAGLGAHAAAARHARARWLGDDALGAPARTWAQAHGVRDLDRFAWMLVPT